MNGNGNLDRAIQEAMEKGRRGPPIPLVTDNQGHVIGVMAVAVAINRPVLETLEQMIRRVVREELATALREPTEEAMA